MPDMKHNLRHGEIPLIEVDHGFERFTAVFLTDDGKYAVYETPQFGGGYRYVGEEFNNVEQAIKKAKEGYP